MSTGPRQEGDPSQPRPPPCSARTTHLRVRREYTGNHILKPSNCVARGGNVDCELGHVVCVARVNRLAAMSFIMLSTFSAGSL